MCTGEKYIPGSPVLRMEISPKYKLNPHCDVRVNEGLAFVSTCTPLLPVAPCCTHPGACRSMLLLSVHRCSWARIRVNHIFYALLVIDGDTQKLFGHCF